MRHVKTAQVRGKQGPLGARGVNILPRRHNIAKIAPKRNLEPWTQEIREQKQTAKQTERIMWCLKPVLPAPAYTAAITVMQIQGNKPSVLHSVVFSDEFTATVSFVLKDSNSHYMSGNDILYHFYAHKVWIRKNIFGLAGSLCLGGKLMCATSAGTQVTVLVTTRSYKSGNKIIHTENLNS